MSDSKEVQIRLTPAMVEAGRMLLWQQLDEIGPTQARNLAEDVFTSMLAASDKENHLVLKLALE